MKIFIYGSGFIARNLIEYLKAFDNNVQIILAYNKHKIIVEQKIKQFSMNESIENILIQKNQMVL